MKFGGVLTGIMIGLGVAGFLVAWEDDGFYIKQQPVNYDTRE